MLELVYWYVYYVNFNIVHWLHFLLAVMLFLSTFLVRFLVWQITGKWLLISHYCFDAFSIIQIDFGKNSSGYSFPKLVSIKGRRVDLISVGIWFNNCFLALNYDLILWVQMNSVNLSCVYLAPMIVSSRNFNKLISCNRISVHVIRYPSDLFRRAKIHSVLDWHHSNLRSGAGM